MSPKNDNPSPEDKPDVSVNISHDTQPEAEAKPELEKLPENEAPVNAPPLPIIESPQPRPVVEDRPAAPEPTPVIQTPVIEEFHEHTGRRWLSVIGFILLALLVAVLVVFAARWVYRKATHKPAKPTSGQQGNVPSAPPTTNPSTGAGQNQAPQTAPTTPQTTTANQLPNNGPGDVLALFVGVAIVTGGLHYLYGLRKAH